MRRELKLSKNIKIRSGGGHAPFARPGFPLPRIDEKEQETVLKNFKQLGSLCENPALPLLGTPFLVPADGGVLKDFLANTFPCTSLSIVYGYPLLIVPWPHWDLITGMPVRFACRWEFGSQGPDNVFVLRVDLINIPFPNGELLSLRVRFPLPASSAKLKTIREHRTLDIINKSPFFHAKKEIRAIRVLHDPEILNGAEWLEAGGKARDSE